MNLQDDPGAVFRELMPETPPSAAFDLDKIVRDGYKTRRRHRAALGGAVTAGVAAVAAAFSVSLVGLPGVQDEEGDPNDAAETSAAEPEVIEDPSMAGYPYDHAWQYPSDPVTNVSIRPEEAQVISDDATAAFGQLLADAGAWDDPLNTIDTGECEYLAETGDEPEGCEDIVTGLPVDPLQRPGNYGQTWLRSYIGMESEATEADDVGLRDMFSLEVLLPGGWTPEPGPVTEQLFPQHLISAGKYYTDTAPEFETTELDDGRTLMVADHGCAYDLAVVYPNGTALRVSWDVDCGGAPERPVALDALTDAVLAMPEYEFDTSALTEVEELMEIPTGWVDEHFGWEDSEEAEAGAAATIDAAVEALHGVYPDATLGSPDARTLGSPGRGVVTHRSYYGGGTLPFETTIDETTESVHFDLRYYLPGGWVPGIDQYSDRGPHIAGCTETAECSGPWFDEDGTGWAAEEEVREYQHLPEEDGGEPIVDHTLQLTMFHPDGWAVSIWATWTGDTPIDVEMFEEILRAMPAPVYDQDAVPEIPAGVDD